MTQLEKYVSKSEIDSLKKLQNAVRENKITITCVGLYNHGKSTLLNILIKDLDLITFKTADARETTINKTIIYNDIKYVDTPGLNAKEEDDEKVMEAIQNSDMTLFVHTISTGELNKKEIQFLKKIQRHWYNPQEFIDRAIFVLSRIDNIENDEDIKNTSKRMKEQIEDIFSCNCLIIPISAMDYKDGMVDNENELIEESNINELEKQIGIIINKSKKAIFETRRKRVEKKLNELFFKLNKQIENNKEKITTLKNEQKKIDEAFILDINKIESTLKNMYKRLEVI